MGVQQPDDVRQKVLVVDDDCLQRELLTEQLERVGLDVRTVPDGRAGLQACGECRFDLILTDYHMPAMTGVEMAVHIRRSDAKTPIILITGDCSTLDSKAVAQAGITGVLAKPFQISELLKKGIVTTVRDTV